MECTEFYADLIYDVGMHQGEDTAFYLAKGFRVVAIEANPELVRENRERFAEKIKSGRLVIVHGAVVPEDDSRVGGTVKFHVGEITEFGTIHSDWSDRNKEDCNRRVMEVPAMRFTDCLREHGIPHYLKIDIEGCDLLCVEALRIFQKRPTYVSIESEKESFKALSREFELLRELGYTGFKAVQQAVVHDQEEPNPPAEGVYAGTGFQRDASGLFGGDLPGAWLSDQQILVRYKKIFRAYRVLGDQGWLTDTWIGKWLIRKLSRRFHYTFPGWYDTHARRTDTGL